MLLQSHKRLIVKLNLVCFLSSRDLIAEQVAIAVEKSLEEAANRRKN